MLFFCGGGDVKDDWGEQFDASVGLAFSLKAFERYRSNGVLSAEVRVIPGVRGRCQVFLEIIEGKVVSCYFVDRTGTRYPAHKELFINLEQIKGTINWTFHEAPALSFSHEAGQVNPRREEDAGS